MNQENTAKYSLKNAALIGIRPAGRQFYQRLRAVIFFSALLLAQPAIAAEWALKLSMNIAEAYSDNIRMAARGNEQGDWVTQISPGLAITAEGPGLKLNTRYQMQNQFYAVNSRQNSTRHQLNADAHSELIKNRLFIDGSASVGQQNISVLGPQTINNLNLTANRADVTTLTVSPYLAHRFGSEADGEIRYTQALVNTNAAGLANTQTGRLALKLDSGDAFNSLAWGLHYSQQQVSYSNYLPAINTATYTGNLGYRITPRFALNAVAGYEKSDYLSTGLPPVGSIYSAGFAWAPGARTTIEASAGQRYFGRNYALNAKHHSRRTIWSVNYSEDITTTQAQFLANTGTFTQLPSGLGNLLSNQVFLQKRLQISATLNGQRNTLTFTLFDALRNAQTPQTQNIALFGVTNQALGNNSKQLGGTAFWSSKITPHTTSNLTLGYAVNSFPSLGITSYDKNLQLGISTQLQTKLNSLIEWRRNQRNSSLANSDYMENTLSASLMMQF